MIVLLSPAKTLDETPISNGMHTMPRHLEESQKLINKLKRKSVSSLQSLMGISENLAKLNKERFQNFEIPFSDKTAKPAVKMFKGDVYLGLQAEAFDKKDLEYAQVHLRILSGLYGLLRPLDLMQAYRLEMGTVLKVGRKKNLYEFWGDSITALINQDLEGTGQQIVVNLASQEYFKSVKEDKIEGKTIHIHFKEDRAGKFKVISFNAKKARGRMAHLMVKERIKQVEELKSLVVDDYVFNIEMSDDLNWVFTK